MPSNCILPCCGYILEPEFVGRERFVQCPACGAPLTVTKTEHQVVEYTAKPNRNPPEL